MTDVFISYRRDDRAKAEALAKALKVENLDVWWDGRIEAGDVFDQKVQTLLQEAKAVIVLWSPSSVKSEWVRGESTIGRQREILVPVMVKPCVIPVPFNVIHAADLSGWSGDRAHPAYRDVVKQVKELAGKADIPPLRPPPNRAIRALWRAVAAVAVLAAIGASVWLFRPWDAIQQATDPAAQAKAKRDASIENLAAYGVSAEDFDQMEGRQIARKRFRPETYPDLVKAAGTGDAPAQTLLCLVARWTEPRSVESDQLARTNCRLSSDAGEPVGQFHHASFMRETGEKEAAARLIETAAQKGYARAQLAYANMLAYGDDVPRDPARAEQVLRAVQAKGIPEADYMLGMFLWEGRLGREPEREEALRLITLAADKGLQLARYDLGMIYANGNGVQQDFARARSLLEAAAAQDDIRDLADKAKGGLRYVTDLERDVAQASTPP